MTEQAKMTDVILERTCGDSIPHCHKVPLTQRSVSSVQRCSYLIADICCFYPATFINLKEHCTFSPILLFYDTTLLTTSKSTQFSFYCPDMTWFISLHSTQGSPLPPPPAFRNDRILFKDSLLLPLTLLSAVPSFNFYPWHNQATLSHSPINNYLSLKWIQDIGKSQKRERVQYQDTALCY